MDADAVAVRVSVVAGPRGEEARTTFADEPEQDEASIALPGIRLFVPRTLVERGATIDVSDEHDTIVVR